MADALRFAEEQEVDLVEISPNAEPPVCKIMDFNKHLFDLKQKQKEAKKKQHQVQVKEIKLRPGLTATTEIKALDRSVLSYITKPITKTFGQAMGER